MLLNLDMWHKNWHLLLESRLVGLCFIHIGLGIGPSPFLLSFHAWSK